MCLIYRSGRKQPKSRGTSKLMLTISGTVLILKVTNELKTRWKACFPVSLTVTERDIRARGKRVELRYHRLLCLSGSYSVCRVEKRKQNPERQTGHRDQQHGVSFGHCLSHFIAGIGLWFCAPPSPSNPNVNGLGSGAMKKPPWCCHWPSQYLKWGAKPRLQLSAERAAPWGKNAVCARSGS